MVLALLFVSGIHIQNSKIFKKKYCQKIEQFVNEQDVWERHQIRAAEQRAEFSGRKRGDEYEYVIEEDIEFVLEQQLGGDVLLNTADGDSSSSSARKGEAADEPHLSAAERKGTCLRYLTTTDEYQF